MPLGRRIALVKDRTGTHTSAVLYKSRATKPITLSASNQLHPGLVLWALVPPVSARSTDRSKFKTEKRFFRTTQLLCYRDVLLSQMVLQVQALICYVRTGPSPTQRQSSEEGNVLRSEPKVSNMTRKTCVQPWDKRVSVRASGPTDLTRECPRIQGPGRHRRKVYMWGWK